MMNGGPSHVDTFDYKPSLAKYAGQPLPADAAGTRLMAFQLASASCERAEFAVHTNTTRGTLPAGSGLV